MKHSEEIELRSPEFAEVWGTPSRKLITISNAIIFCISIGLLAFLYFFNYPQQIVKRGLVVGNECVLQISSQQVGKISMSTTVYFQSDLHGEKYSAQIDTIFSEPKKIGQDYFYQLKIIVNSNFENSIPGNFVFIVDRKIL